MKSAESNDGRIVVLNRDLFFGVRLKQLGAELGYEVELAPDSNTFVELIRLRPARLGIIDINARPDWAVIEASVQGRQLPPILAFGPHLDVEGLRAAKAAGVTRVVSNGTFHCDAAVLMERYASRTERDFPIEPDEEVEQSLT